MIANEINRFRRLNLFSIMVKNTETLGFLIFQKDGSKNEVVRIFEI